MHLLLHAQALTWGDLPTYLRALVVSGYIFAAFAVVWGVVMFYKLAVLYDRQRKRDQQRYSQWLLDGKARDDALVENLREALGYPKTPPPVRDDRPS